MKYIHNHLFILLILLFIVGCSDDDDEGIKLSIVKSEVTFDANAGTGYIQVSSAKGAITASSDMSWCTVEVSGDKVTVKVLQNETISGRTALISIMSENELVQVPATQSGSIFAADGVGSGMTVSFDGGDKTITVNSVLPIQISTNDNWIQYHIDGDQITFTAPATDNPRIDTVKIQSGPNVLKFPVRQIIPNYQYYIGTFKFNYTDDFIEPNEMDVTLVEKVRGVSYTMSGAKFNFDFEVKFRASDGAVLIIPQKVGRGVNDGFFGDGETYDIYLGLWGTDASYTPVTNSTSVSLKGILDIVENEFKVVYTDGGGWEHGAIDAINFAFFDDENYYINDYYGDIFAAMYFDISMTKK